MYVEQESASPESLKRKTKVHFDPVLCDDADADATCESEEIIALEIDENNASSNHLRLSSDAIRPLSAFAMRRGSVDRDSAMSEPFSGRVSPRPAVSPLADGPEELEWAGPACRRTRRFSVQYNCSDDLFRAPANEAFALRPLRRSLPGDTSPVSSDLNPHLCRTMSPKVAFTPPPPSECWRPLTASDPLSRRRSIAVMTGARLMPIFDQPSVDFDKRSLDFGLQLSGVDLRKLAPLPNNAPKPKVAGLTINIPPRRLVLQSSVPPPATAEALGEPIFPERSQSREDDIEQSDEGPPSPMFSSLDVRTGRLSLGIRTPHA